ncbi:uncharacterized protein LOC135160457 [Diachasmimorpha longicaudata]|uniref:uncharacterized protein LOC135160457 n=1 Tax=Diachasmimorpha longicaudata TaxID=58733 RepID=UPI0030B8E1AB
MKHKQFPSANSLRNVLCLEPSCSPSLLSPTDVPNSPEKAAREVKAKRVAAAILSPLRQIEGEESHSESRRHLHWQSSVSNRRSRIASRTIGRSYQPRDSCDRNVPVLDAE